MWEGSTRFSRARAERTIAVTRVGIIAFSLFAIWFDPAEPIRFASLTYLFHAGYIGYAMALAWVMWNRSSTGWLPLATQVIDIVAFSVFQYLTLGSSSPFFTYFTFSLFAGAVRWGWRGVAATAPAVLAAYLLIAVATSLTPGPVAFELDRFIIRTCYLVVVAVLLVYLGLHEARLRDEIQRLARWPDVVGDDVAAEIKQALDYAVGIVEAGKVVVVWEPDQEPRMQLAVWTPDTFQHSRHESSALEPWVADELARVSFVCSRESTEAMVVATDRSRLGKVWLGDPVMPGLRAHVGDGAVATAPFQTDQLSGRVFFGALRTASVEVLPHVDVVARELGITIDKCEVHKRARQVAIGEERIRVARELHDGVLQSLTGIRLELQSLATQLGGTSTQETRDRLAAMERALAVEQRELRFFIEGLQPGRPTSRVDGNLGAMLEDLTRQIAAQWKTPVTLRVTGTATALPPAVERALPPMIHEAVVNALKHGQPTRVSVTLQGRLDGLRVVVSDDGRGFPFEGQYTHDALVQQNLGPASLCARAASLGGDVSVESSPSGSRVEIHLPVAVPA